MNRADVAAHAGVGRQGQRHPAAGRGTVHRRDQGLGHRLHAHGQVGERLLHLHAGLHRPLTLEGGQVVARTEAPTGTGEDDRPARVVALQLIECGVQLLDQLVGHGIEALGPVEREQHDLGSATFDEDSGHRGRGLSVRFS